MNYELIYFIGLFVVGVASFIRFISNHNGKLTFEEFNLHLLFAVGYGIFWPVIGILGTLYLMSVGLYKMVSLIIRKK